MSESTKEWLIVPNYKLLYIATASTGYNQQAKIKAATVLTSILLPVTNMNASSYTWRIEYRWLHVSCALNTFLLEVCISLSCINNITSATLFGLHRHHASSYIYYYTLINYKYSIVVAATFRDLSMDVLSSCINR